MSRQWYFFLVILLALLITTFTETNETFVKNLSLSDDGAQIIPNQISPSKCARIKAEIDRELKDSRREIGDINDADGKRFDVHLNLKGAVYEIVDEIWKTHWKLIMKTLEVERTNDITLVELSALVTRAGATNPQEWHRDVAEELDATRLLSIGVALQNITEDMGPLEIVAKSHRDILDSDIDEPDATKMVCKQGDLVFWDSTIYHRGGGNTSSRDRYVFYLTLAGKSRNLPDGSTYSLKRKLKYRGDSGPKLHDLFRG